MHVICSSTNGNCSHFVFSSDTAEIGPKARLQLGRYERKSFLGAENTVHEVADIRMRHRESLLSAVRFADLVVICDSDPSDESLGYFHFVRFADSDTPEEPRALDQFRKNSHRLAHLFIRIEKMRRHAQADTGTAIDKDFSLVQALDHRRSIVDADHY